MADNPTPPTPPSKSGAQPPLPSSGTTGRLPALPTQLPVKKGGAGKIVVMLSSVAKPPPAVTQSLLLPTPPAGAAQPSAPASPAAAASPQSPLPPKQVAPAKNPPPVNQPRLSTTTHVKLPPKTSVPQLSSLAGTPAPAPVAKPAPASKSAPPPLPAKWSEPKKGGAQHIPPIKLNEQSLQEDLPGESSESIFAPADKSVPAPKPAGWKSLEPGELNPPPGGLQSLDVFERSQRIEGKPPVETTAPEAKAKAAPLVAPPLLPPTKVEPPPAAAGSVPMLRPPPLPPTQTKPVESAPPPSLQVAPPLLEKEPELPAEKLPPPVHPSEAPKAAATAINPPPVLSPKPLLPPTPPTTKPTGSPMKQSTPLIVSSTSPKVPVPKIAEAKPALKPPTLPKRAMPLPSDAPAPETPAPTVDTAKATEEINAPENVDAAIPVVHVPEMKATVHEPKMAAPLHMTKEDVASALGASAVVAGAAAFPKKDQPVPLTRAERSKKRRLVSMLIFWCLLVPITGAVLYIGSLYIGRETRVEGQVIPPSGMTLNTEVWIVSDFRDLASGIADDLAKERTPLLEEIQERQDHVQRAQADVASREERIRLIQEQIQAAKDEINAVVKQSRDATQQVWDVDGAAIDNEYTSRLNELQRTITDRAKSLNLKYEPDPNFQSPEVWANAYRLALYQVPAGVDSVKEHQWLADQMKQWRDYEKSLDDRKEQLRDKAAQIKLAPAPKIADLNAKIADLQQRSDTTAAEEVPLKEELQQAQTDLGLAQGTEAGLDDKYYKQLDSLPEEAVTKHIPLAINGRFSWVDDDVFAEGEKEHRYWLFSRATRSDGRQYWLLMPFSIEKFHKSCFIIDPESFISTKAILRPNLSPDEQAE